MAKLLHEAHQAYPSPLHSGSKFREVIDPLSWVFVFLNFVAVKLEDPETRSLIAYEQTVLDLARKHGGTGWLAYGTHFRGHFWLQQYWGTLSSGKAPKPAPGVWQPTIRHRCAPCHRWTYQNQFIWFLAGHHLSARHLGHTPPPLSLEPALTSHVGATTRACAL